MSRLRHAVQAALLLCGMVSACSKPETASVSVNREHVDHDRQVARILTCGGGVFEYEGAQPDSRYDLSVKDGAEILVSLGHQVGFGRISGMLGLGDDAGWLEGQFIPGGYELRKEANKTAVSASYLLGQYARQYCIAHPLNTLADAIDNLAAQITPQK